MNPREKVLLLAEMFGVDVSDKISDVLKEIENNNHYKQLVINVEMAKKYQVPYSQNFLKEYEETKLANIGSFKDALVARAKIDYLYQISQPKYFINPIMFNPLEMSTSITTIGELPCYFKNKEYSINQLISNPDIKYDDKIKVIKELTNKWREDAKNTVIDEINHQLMGKKQSKLKKLVYAFKRGLVFYIFIILGVALFLVTIFSSSEFFHSVVHNTNVTSIAFFIYSIVLFLFMGADALDAHAERSRTFEKEYCLYYLKSHAYLAIKNLEDASFNIRELLIRGIKEKRAVDTNITKINYLVNFRRIVLFLNLDDKEIDENMESLLNVYHSIRVTMLVMFILSFLFYGICLVISLLNGGVI